MASQYATRELKLTNNRLRADLKRALDEVYRLKQQAPSPVKHDQVVIPKSVYNAMLRLKARIEIEEGKL